MFGEVRLRSPHLHLPCVAGRLAVGYLEFNHEPLVPHPASGDSRPCTELYVVYASGARS